MGGAQGPAPHSRGHRFTRSHSRLVRVMGAAASYQGRASRASTADKDEEEPSHQCMQPIILSWVSHRDGQLTSDEAHTSATIRAALSNHPTRLYRGLNEGYTKGDC